MIILEEEIIQNVPITLDLGFFSEKTEKATPKKRKDARKEGQVLKSQEIGTAFLFISAFMALKSFAPYMMNQIMGVFDYGLKGVSLIDEVYNKKAILNYMTYIFSRIIFIVAPVFFVIMAVGLVANIIQVGWNPTGKALQPKLSNLNPMKGFKRLVSFKLIVDLIKALLKFAVIIMTIYNIVKDEVNVITKFIEFDLVQGTIYMANLCADVGINVGILYLVIAGIDYGYQKFKHEKDLRMSKQDIKEEYKQSEGDPNIKGKIKQRMREASMRRMMQEVPTADVIITNPTHFAVALKYDRDKGEAPILIAKGADHLAQKIKSVAQENHVVIVENKPLARTLYSTVEIGREIPPELYQTVAEVLAYVYKLKNNA